MRKSGPRSRSSRRAPVALPVPLTRYSRSRPIRRTLAASKMGSCSRGTGRSGGTSNVSSSSMGEGAPNHRAPPSKYSVNKRGAAQTI